MYIGRWVEKRTQPKLTGNKRYVTPLQEMTSCVSLIKRGDLRKVFIAVSFIGFIVYFNEVFLAIKCFCA